MSTTEVTLFKNKAGATCIVLPTLERINFAAGKFFTTDKNLEAKLAKLAETQDYGVYVDPKEPVVDTKYQNPMDALKEKLKLQGEAEFRAKLLEMANNPEFKDAGISQQSLQSFLASIDNSMTPLITGKQETAEQASIKTAQQTATTQPASATGAALLAKLNQTNQDS